jgi:hypothetical protein
MLSSAGGVNGLVADICASKGSSKNAKLSFLGGFRLEMHDVTGDGECGRVDRCEVWRDRGLLR